MLEIDPVVERKVTHDSIARIEMYSPVDKIEIGRGHLKYVYDALDENNHPLVIVDKRQNVYHAGLKYVFNKTEKNDEVFRDQFWQNARVRVVEQQHASSLTSALLVLSRIPDYFFESPRTILSEFSTPNIKDEGDQTGYALILNASYWIFEGTNTWDDGHVQGVTTIQITDNKHPVIIREVGQIGIEGGQLVLHPEAKGDRYFVATGMDATDGIGWEASARKVFERHFSSH